LNSPLEPRPRFLTFIKYTFLGMFLREKTDLETISQ
jgi:hypothetical protein